MLGKSNNRNLAASPGDDSMSDPECAASKTVLVETNSKVEEIGCEANSMGGIGRGAGKNIGGDPRGTGEGDDRVRTREEGREGERVGRVKEKVGGKEKSRNKSRKEGGRGKVKQVWSKEERLVLWECYIRSGGRVCNGYIKRVMNMWNGRDLSVRSQASILSQIKCIENGGLLSEFEKREISNRVRSCAENSGRLNESNENDIDFVVWDEEQALHTASVTPVDGLLECGGKRQDAVLKLPRLDNFKESGYVRLPSKEEDTVLKRIREIFQTDDMVEIPSLKAKDRRRVMKEVNIVNGLLHNVYMEKVDVTSVNRLLYAGSYVVCERMGLMKSKGKVLKSKKPWWQRRLEKRIVQWRKDLGRIHELSKLNKLKDSVMCELERRYQLRNRGLLQVRTFIENKVKAASSKIRAFVESNLQSRQNRLFKNNQAQLYKELGGRTKSLENQAPNPEETQAFWRGIWSDTASHNTEALWLRDVEGRFSSVSQQDDISISDDDVLLGIRKMTNWKAPGPDGVRGFWFKKFTSIQPLIVKALKKCLGDGLVPHWMTKGRTVLIQKDPAKGTVVGNYRPIACLPLMWKLLTGIFARKINEHLSTNGLLMDEQKGCRKRSRGTKDQLLIDKAILREVKEKKRCLSMAWIDYKKAYDMVPHDWILKVMKLCKVAGNLSSLVGNSMTHWKTELTCLGQNLGSVDINRGIFQGDSLSPLLFVLAMMPLTILLRREEKFGYALSGFNYPVNHLLFMDDLKLYAKSENCLKGLTSIVAKFSKDIRMTFGIEKCSSVVIKAGVKVFFEGIELPSGEMIQQVENSGYKYLGILQESEYKHQEMKELVRGEYLRRTKAVARSKLYSQNLFKAINAWAVSSVRYSAGILDWSEKELKDIDIKTRKILTMNGVFHKK